ncbi:MAG: M20/M25/M40 family metallo-hydrolase [Gemmataceae bacterium]
MIDPAQAEAFLMRFLAVEGITGQEQAIGAEVRQALIEIGVPSSAIRFDQAHTRIPLPTQTGNLIVQLPGTRPGPRRLFSTHLDTVPLCAGARPIKKGKRIVPAGKTALGGDNRTGVGCLVTLAATLRQQRLPHPPLTLLFTVREESGLWGARQVDPNDLGKPAEGYNVDGGAAARLTIGAVGADRWDVEIVGRAAHAGVHPEQGISATAVAALGLADIVRRGWFGKVSQNGQEGTSNVGYFGGQDGHSAGVATNVVTDYAQLRGESRSHDARFIRAITSAYRQAFQAAAQQVRDHRGKTAKVTFRAERSYEPFRLKDKSPLVQRAVRAAEHAGLKPVLEISNGGLDANWLVKHGIPAVTFGAGQHEIHTVDEYVELAEYFDGCRLAVALATATD